MLGVCIACVACLSYYADWVAYFFLAQAVIPWLLAIGYSFVTGRSIIYDRYFSFATFAWLCFLGCSWYRMPMGLIKIIIGLVTAGLLFAGLLPEVKSGASAKAYEDAARFLRDNYQEGDVCWTDFEAQVNTLRYYLRQSGLEHADVRCQFTPGVHGGHVVHLGSLSGDDLFTGEFPERKRIWRCSPMQWLSVRAPPRMTETMRRTFHGPNGTFYSVVLLELAKE
jgi:hypothetical protein